ncbi:MAG: bifunctional nuclease family protein, partial [Planctomycetota bacterium]
GFPIIIGTSEASEIQRVLTNRQPQRPLTHQLAHSAIEALGARLERVDIVDLRDNTFFARVVLVRDEEEFQLDARPSDALALGLRAGCPIRVAESILESTRTDTSGPDPLPPPTEPPPAEPPGEAAEETPDEPQDPSS